MDFVVGLAMGLLLGAFIATIGSPIVTMWLARREHEKASLGADDGPFPRVEVPTSDRFRSPQHAK